MYFLRLIGIYRDQACLAHNRCSMNISICQTWQMLNSIMSILINSERWLQVFLLPFCCSSHPYSTQNYRELFVQLCLTWFILCNKIQIINKRNFQAFAALSCIQFPQHMVSIVQMAGLYPVRYQVGLLASLEPFLSGGSKTHCWFSLTTGQELQRRHQ